MHDADRAKDCPSPDAASSDLNKIVREDYADPVYSDLALEASKHWLNNPFYKPFFHQSGRAFLLHSHTNMSRLTCCVCSTRQCKRDWRPWS